MVYIFALVAEKLGFAVTSVQNPFPYCQATWDGKRARIEFEYRSRNFTEHEHDARKCDLVVCWRHDWPGMPSGLAVLELRKVFGIAREVFMVAYQERFWSRLPDGREPDGLWSVPASSGPGDILLVYRPQTGGWAGGVTDVFRVHTPPEVVASPGWRDKSDWMAEIERIARLKAPITLPRLKELRVAGGIESRPRRTKQWPALYRELTEHARPSHSLKRYARL